jgi:hypothetical protein
MGAGLVTLSLLYWATTRIPSVEGRFWEPIRSSTRGTRDALFGGAVALSLSLSIALLVLLIENNIPTLTTSYYQQLLAENATYLSFYALCVLGAYFPLASLEGTEFAAVWTAVYYLVGWVQGISLITFIFSAIDNGGTIQFGDQPCLKVQLGSSPINNPILYSIVFVVLGAASRFLIIGIYVLKVAKKFFESRAQWLINGPRKHSFRALLKELSNTESLSFIITLPLTGPEVLIALLSVSILIFFGPSNRSNTTKIVTCNNLARSAEMNLKRLSNGAWVLAIVSIPFMWLEVAYILRLRNAMKTISGPAWIENQWGFGQILALLIWMPVVVGFTLTFGKSSQYYIWPSGNAHVISSAYKVLEKILPRVAEWLSKSTEIQSPDDVFIFYELQRTGVA